MGRAILAAFAGYLTLAVIVMAGFSLVLIAPTFAYQPDSLDVTGGWLVYTIGLSFVAAVLGGFVCGRDRAAVSGR